MDFNDRINTAKDNNLKIRSYLKFMRDWVYKSLENQRVNLKYSKLSPDEMEEDHEIKQLIRLSISKNDDSDDLFLRKYYDICEFSRTTKIGEITDTSQQQFMVDFVNATFQLIKNQEDRIQQLEIAINKPKVI